MFVRVDSKGSYTYPCLPVDLAGKNGPFGPNSVILVILVLQNVILVILVLLNCHTCHTSNTTHTCLRCHEMDVKEQVFPRAGRGMGQGHKSLGPQTGCKRAALEGSASEIRRPRNESNQSSLKAELWFRDRCGPSAEALGYASAVPPGLVDVVLRSNAPLKRCSTR